MAGWPALGSSQAKKETPKDWLSSVCEIALLWFPRIPGWVWQFFKFAFAFGFVFERLDHLKSYQTARKR